MRGRGDQSIDYTSTDETAKSLLRKLDMYVEFIKLMFDRDLFSSDSTFNIDLSVSEFITEIDTDD